jgi:hypothetical protein
MNAGLGNFDPCPYVSVDLAIKGVNPGPRGAPRRPIAAAADINPHTGIRKFSVQADMQ